MHHQDFLRLRAGDILSHPNGGALMIVVNRDFWMKKAKLEIVQEFREKHREEGQLVFFRYLGLGRIEMNLDENPESENISVVTYSFMHYADLVYLGISAENIFMLSEILPGLNRKEVNLLRSDLMGIIEKNTFWKKALKKTR